MVDAYFIIIIFVGFFSSHARHMSIFLTTNFLPVIKGFDFANGTLPHSLLYFNIHNFYRRHYF